MKRKKYIELLRIFSMLSVVLIHVCTTALTDFEGYSSIQAGVYYALISILHYAVPIFFMISGILLLNPEKEISLKKFLTKYVWKYLLVTMCFGWAYAYIELLFQSRQFVPQEIVSAFFNMLSGKTWAHMWYMYALLGTILLLPILRCIIKYLNKQELRYVLIVGVLFLSIIPMFEQWFDVRLGIAFPISSIYPLYMLIGYAWEQRCENEKGSWLSLITIVLVTLVLASTGFVKENCQFEKLSLLNSYFSPLVLIQALCIVKIFYQNDRIKRGYEYLHNGILAQKFIQLLEHTSFCVYLIHMFWINIFYKFLKINPFQFNFIIGILGIWFSIVILSVATSWIMKKIPIVKKFL